jgi:hypothetical protein
LPVVVALIQSPNVSLMLAAAQRRTIPFYLPLWLYQGTSESTETGKTTWDTLLDGCSRVGITDLLTFSLGVSKRSTPLACSAREAAVLAYVVLECEIEAEPVVVVRRGIVCRQHFEFL